MNKINWVTDIKEYLLKGQVYEIAAVCREIERDLVKSGEIDDMFDINFLDQSISRFTDGRTDHFKSQFLLNIYPRVMEISLPYLREYKISKIIKDE
jgi:hypothetical protein